MQHTYTKKWAQHQWRKKYKTQLTYTYLSIKITNYLPNYLEHTPSWEANRSSDNEEIPHISWKPKVHYGIHKYPPTVLILCQSNLVHATHPTYWRSILILSSCLHLGLHQVSWQKPCMHLSCPPFMPHVVPSPPNNIWWGVQITKLPLCSILHSQYQIPIRPKYHHQHPILVHPQPMFLLQCERPSLTPTQNRWNYSSAYPHLYIFLDTRLEDKKTLHWMIARIPQLQS